MEQTPEQKAASLNPTPVTFSVPTQGLFIGGSNSGKDLGVIYKMSADGTSAQAYDITQLLTPEQKAGKNYGQQVDIATNLLKTQYGFDVNSLPMQNMADLNSSGYLQPLAVKLGKDLNGFQINQTGGDFLGFTGGTKVAGSSTVTANTEAQSLAPLTQPLQQAQAQPLASSGNLATASNLYAAAAGYTGVSIVDFLNMAGQASDFDSRAVLAAKYGMTNYTGTAEQNTALLNVLRELAKTSSTTGTTSGTTTTTNSQGVAETPVATATGLSGSATPAPVVTANTSSAAADQTEAAAKAALEEYKTGLNTQTTEKTQYNALSQQISDLLPSITGRGAAQTAKEEELGIPAMKAALTTTTNQLSTALAEYQAIKLAQSNDLMTAANKPVTMGTISGESNRLNFEYQIKLNSKAAEIGFLQAQVQIAQNNLNGAQTTADKAIELKYQDAEAILNVKLKQLDLLRDLMTTEEAKKADILQKQYELQLSLLADQKANDKTRTTQLLNWMSTYPDAGITLNDTIEGAQSKITTKSEIYKQETNKTTYFTTDENGQTVQYQKDANGAVIPSSRTVLGGTTTTTTTGGNALSILDVQRYNDLYPEANVIVGDTEAQANTKVAKINTPEAKVRSLVVKAKDAGNTYDVVVNEINNDSTITDKETAIKIAQEVYGVTPELGGAVTPIYGKGNFSNIDINDRKTQLEAIKGFTSSDVRAQLKNDGYPLSEINKIAGNIIDKLTGFLFGE